MLLRIWRFYCDDCLDINYFVRGIEEARKKGWAIARDRVHCYCPDCAFKHRNVGRKKKQI